MNYHGREDDVCLRSIVGLDVACDIVEHANLCELEGHLYIDILCVHDILTLTLAHLWVA